MDTRVIKKFAGYLSIVVGTSIAVASINIAGDKLLNNSWIGTFAIFMGLGVWGIYDFAKAKVEFERWQEQRLIDKMSQPNKEHTW